LQLLGALKGKGKRKQQSECGAGEIETLATIEQLAKLKLNDLRRASSDNRLVDKKNSRNARLHSSRPHLSVARVDKLTSRRAVSRQGGGGGGGSLAGGVSLAGVRQQAQTHNTMRRVSSYSGLNSNYYNGGGGGGGGGRTTRLDSNQDSDVLLDPANLGLDTGGGGGGGGGGSEDSEEEEEKSQRIREWLSGLDFADAPPEPDIEYDDDPPQTDTALHIVYQEA
jgi:hypothetical protein